MKKTGNVGVKKKKVSAGEEPKKKTPPGGEIGRGQGGAEKKKAKLRNHAPRRPSEKKRAKAAQRCEKTSLQLALLKKGKKE